MPSEEDSGCREKADGTVEYSVRVGAPPSCHWKEVRVALATELTKILAKLGYELQKM